MKVCARCGETKILDDFHLRYQSFYGEKRPFSWCKECSRGNDRSRQGTEKFKRNRKNNELKKNYGIDINIYEQMLKEQTYSCKICGKKEGDSGKPLAVDHCHDTGAVRGLLCVTCNTDLGHYEKLEKDFERKLRLIQYLTKAGNVK